MTTGTTTEVLTGDVYMRSSAFGHDDIWVLVLSAKVQTVVDHWKMPANWREQFVQKPWVKTPYIPGYVGGIHSSRKFNIT